MGLGIGWSTVRVRRVGELTTVMELFAKIEVLSSKHGQRDRKNGIDDDIQTKLRIHFIFVFTNLQESSSK